MASVASQATPTAALSRLRVLFPHADPGFLLQAVQYHLAIDGDLTEAAVVQRVSDKCLEMKGEVPFVALKNRRGATTSSGKEKEKGQVIGGLRRRKKGAAGLREGEQDDLQLVVDRELTQNLALIRLHAIFPSTPIPTLRTLLSPPELSHSWLHLTIEHLLSHPELVSPPPPTTPTLTLVQRFLSPFRPSSDSDETDPLPLPPQPELLPRDMLHSSRYYGVMYRELQRAYPNVSGEVIRSFVLSAEKEGQEFAEVEARVVAWGEVRKGGWGGLGIRVKGWFEGGKGRRARGWEWEGDSEEEEEDEECQELRREMRARRGSVSSVGSGSSGATAAAAAAYPEADSLPFPSPPLDGTEHAREVECQCCYDTLPSSLAIRCLASSPSSPAEHVFCPTCLTYQVGSIVHSSSPLHPSGDGVRCLSSAGDGCDSKFGADDLRRAIGVPLLAKLEARIAAAAVEMLEGVTGDGKGKLVRCPGEGCGYAELNEEGEGRPWARCFPAWLEEAAYVEFGAWVQTLWSAMVLVVLHLVVLVAVFIAPERFAAISLDRRQQRPPKQPQPQHFPLLEPLRALGVVHAFLASLALGLLPTAPPLLLYCRNTPDGQPLPLEMGNGVEEVLAQGGGWSEFRRAVWPCLPSSPELDRPWCGVISCIGCGKDVRGQGHACDVGKGKEGLRLAVERARSEAVKRICGKCGVAFVKENGRDGGCNKTPGPCTECTRCSLWITPDDEQAAAVAGRQAREAWLKHKDQDGAVDAACREGLEDDWFMALQKWCEDGLRWIVL